MNRQKSSPGSLDMGRSHSPVRLKLVSVSLVVVAIAAANLQTYAQQVRKTKYAADVVRLYRDHAFLQRHPAPDYWALSPYYASQQNDSSCSVAVVAMVVNALRAERDLHPADQLVTQSVLLEKLGNDRWTRQVNEGGDGVTLAELSGICHDAMRAYGIDEGRVETVSFPATTDDALKKLHRLLSDNERTDRDLIVVNVVQGMLTGDPDGMVGHFAPVAAYDAAGRRVLILDPDRRWYEPYWVPLEKLLAAMATVDRLSNNPRGLLRVER